ncbi:outer membrane beta-barrel protein [Bradyrhizobium sp. UNPA324]|uniref:outer membrane protein n=1 Tax=Bradyrhizobium sp. UNPA324 TaxID=1141174 RepID=UPI0015EF8650|nr:outer membrane beta-barrel protein [Bradyrhizobium sp. UNPA324]
MTRLLRLSPPAIAGLLVVSAANAADLPVKAPIFKTPAAVEAWGGLYVGASLGFRASESSVDVRSATDTTAPAVLQNMFVAADCFAGLPCVTGRSFNGTAFRVGPYLGYNWQIGRTVLGLEGDAAYADQTTTIFGAAYPATPFNGGASTSNSFALKTTWDASIRGRAGYLIDPAVLLYGTAGPSWIHVQTTSNCSTLVSADGRCVPGVGLAPVSISNSRTQLGYTVGGGIEAMLWPNWIARAEYRFADYGHFSNTDVRTAATGGQTVSYDTFLKTHTATFGLAYKFGTANATGATALAAYAAAPSTASWNGAYLGVGAGIRASQASSSIDAASFTTAGFPPINLLNGCGDCFRSDQFHTTAARISPYLGYNWQIDPKWLLGVEGDFGWADRQSSVFGRYLPGGIVGGSGGLNDSYSLRTKWDASIRARVGYIINPAFLAYLTGGAAWTSLEQTSNCDTALKPLFTAPGFVASEVGNCTPGLLSPAVIRQSTVRTGFTVGGGGEMKLTESWILRGEYRYADFGTARFSQTRDCNGSATINDPAFGVQTVFCSGTQSTTNSVRLQSHTATFGIAYRFN